MCVGVLRVLHFLLLENMVAPAFAGDWELVSGCACSRESSSFWNWGLGKHGTGQHREWCDLSLCHSVSKIFMFQRRVCQFIASSHLHWDVPKYEMVVTPCHTSTSLEFNTDYRRLWDHVEAAMPAIHMLSLPRLRLRLDSVGFKTQNCKKACSRFK
jgi:hypothetical protein